VSRQQHANLNSTSSAATTSALLLRVISFAAPTLSLAAYFNPPVCHEHFGFYLSWGDLVWLPFVYTLQGLFLSTHAVQLCDAGAAAVLALGVGGYALFRAVNAQKDRFRKEMKRLDAIAEAEADGAIASVSSTSV